MDTIRLLLEDVEELERVLEKAQDRITELEDELKQWRSGAKSLAAERLRES